MLLFLGLPIRSHSIRVHVMKSWFISSVMKNAFFVVRIMHPEQQIFDQMILISTDGYSMEPSKVMECSDLLEVNHWFIHIFWNILHFEGKLDLILFEFRRMELCSDVPDLLMLALMQVLHYSSFPFIIIRRIYTIGSLVCQGHLRKYYIELTPSENDEQESV